MHVAVNGQRPWCDVDGSGLVPEGPGMRERPTVVLLHGGPGSFDHSYLKPDFARLATVAQVVYLDLPGHGLSEHGNAADWSFELAGDLVRAFCDVVGIAKPVVYGHSLGSFVALTYAVRHPAHPGALVLQSAAARFDVDRVVEGFRRAGGDEVAEIARRSYGGDSDSVGEEEWARCFRLFGPNVVGEAERSRTACGRRAARSDRGRRALHVEGRPGALLAAAHRLRDVSRASRAARFPACRVRGSRSGRARP